MTVDAAPGAERRPVDEDGSGARRIAALVERRPGAAVALLVVVGWIALASLALGAPAPRIFPDELIYMDAASELADGARPAVRGDGYGYGPVYPLVAAPVLALAPDRDAAYPALQVLNALLFALVAVPAFLLARLAVSSGWAIVTAALALLVPSSVYVAGVLTESLAYLAFTVAALLLVRALVEPRVGRQLAAIAAIAVAAGVRTQFAVLAPAALVALLATRAIVPERERRDLRAYWPVWAVTVAGALAVAGLLASGRSPSDLLGSYGVLADAHSLPETAGWLVDHAALLIVYLVVVPVIVAPSVLGDWLRAGRTGVQAPAALVATVTTVTLAMLLVVAWFATSEYAGDVLHDRSLFYVTPLWMVVFCAWLAGGLKRPLVVMGITTVVALALVAQMRYPEQGALTFLWETVAFEPWQFVERGNPTGSPFSGREAMAGFAVIAAAAAWFVPRTSRWVLVVLVGSVLAFAGSLAWAHGHEGSRSVERRAFVPGTDRSWVDAATGGEEALLLMVPRGCRGEVDEASRRLTEFFNDAVGRVMWLAEPDILTAGSPARLRPVGRDGAILLDAHGVPVTARIVVTRVGVPVRGTRVAAGTRSPLVAWRTSGPIRLEVGSTGALLRSGCP